MTDPDLSTPTESHVDLPANVDVESDFDVYINGVLQQVGIDYRVDGRLLVFPRALTAEKQMTKFQFVRTALGIAGTYTKHDSIDVAYKHEGRRFVATGLTPRSHHG